MRIRSSLLARGCVSETSEQRQERGRAIGGYLVFASGRCWRGRARLCKFRCYRRIFPHAGRCMGGMWRAITSTRHGRSIRSYPQSYGREVDRPIQGQCWPNHSLNLLRAGNASHVGVIGHGGALIFRGVGVSAPSHGCRCVASCRSEPRTAAYLQDEVTSPPPSQVAGVPLVANSCLAQASIERN